MRHKTNKVFVAGHRGMVGSAIKRALSNKSNIEIITATKDALDLTNQQEVMSFFKNNEIDQVYLAAAKVGGIYANSTYPADFIYINLMIQNNIINSAYKTGIKKLLFLGSSCIYPKESEQPIKEDFLLSGKLENTNEPYAIAKIAGIKLCQSINRQYSSEGFDFRSVMPTNLYGPGDNYNLEDSHVIPALIRKFHEAKKNNQHNVEVWGSGSPRREFLHVDDMADACIHIMNLDKNYYEKIISKSISHINVGYGEDITIKELANLIKKIIGYEGKIIFDSKKPDGTMKKLLDTSLLAKTGWLPQINLEDGLIKTYNYFLNDKNYRN